MIARIDNFKKGNLFINAVYIKDEIRNIFSYEVFTKIPNSNKVQFGKKVKFYDVLFENFVDFAKAVENLKLI
ncbi:hypothetical protein H2274_07020 [Campylobacter sp. W0049]|uniref:hypothetical protein n=1 Tax=Campylobacter molothri TaxID=1032242 RepID=UPI00301D7892|nr:hypothetical protein [Campylobacter sp. W0049]